MLYGHKNCRNYYLIITTIIIMPSIILFLCELYLKPSPTLSSTKYTYMKICVIHAVCTMFSFVCLDNCNNVAARCIGYNIAYARCIGYNSSCRVGHFDVSMTTNIESIFTFFIPIPENKDTR